MRDSKAIFPILSKRSIEINKRSEVSYRGNILFMLASVRQNTTWYCMYIHSRACYLRNSIVCLHTDGTVACRSRVYYNFTNVILLTVVPVRIIRT